METNEELKKRIVERLDYRIMHPSGVFRGNELKKRAYGVGKQYSNKYISEHIIESILLLKDGEEKEKKFDELCESIVNDLVSFKRNIEDSAQNGENWHSKINIEDFLRFKKIQ